MLLLQRGSGCRCNFTERPDSNTTLHNNKKYGWDIAGESGLAWAGLAAILAVILHTTQTGLTMDNTFDILFLIACPAAGKSEIIDYLKRTAE